MATSGFTTQVNETFLIVFIISAVLMVGVTLALIYFVYRYHHTRNAQGTDIHGNITLEVTWTVIPSILVLGMFYYGWEGYVEMRTVPEDALVVETSGRMWSWFYDYENGLRTDTLFVPISKAIKLNLHSQDVLHSYYIPAMMVKQDAVPSGKSYLWFRAEEEGYFQVLCAEYCGDDHSYMYSYIKVMPQAEFDAWYAKESAALGYTVPAPVKGEQLVQTMGCITCHSTDGSERVGASFKGLFGAERNVLTAGNPRAVIADEDYLRRSILEPNADKVEASGWSRDARSQFVGRGTGCHCCIPENIAMIQNASMTRSITDWVKIVTELSKIRISQLVAISTGLGYIMATGRIDVGLLLPVLGTFLLSCSAASLNQYQERQTDRLMPRTKSRPLASGKITPGEGLFIIVVLAISGSLLLATGAGQLALGLGLLNTCLLYNGMYTPH